MNKSLVTETAVDCMESENWVTPKEKEEKVSSTK